MNISDVMYQDMYGTSVTPMAMQFQCSKKFPFSGIRLQDVNLTYNNQPVGASCYNAGGTASGVMKPTSCL